MITRVNSYQSTAYISDEARATKDQLDAQLRGNRGGSGSNSNITTAGTSISTGGEGGDNNALGGYI